MYIYCPLFSNLLFTHCYSQDSIAHLYCNGHVHEPLCVYPDSCSRSPIVSIFMLMYINLERKCWWKTRFTDGISCICGAQHGVAKPKCTCNRTAWFWTWNLSKPNFTFDNQIWEGCSGFLVKGKEMSGVGPLHCFRIRFIHNRKWDTL